MMNITSVGIVGAGTMGSRIAYQCALHGKKVYLYDISPDVMDNALEKIRNWNTERFDPAKVEANISRIYRCETLKECAENAELIIENVPENLELKRKVFAEIDRLAPPHVLIATNSSSLPSSRLADATNRPEKVFNVNFGDPVHGGMLVEMMGHSQVDEDTMSAGEQFLLSIKMVPIITRKEIMGFSFNRVWRVIKRETLHLVSDGYAHFEDIDRAWILTFGTEWGPFGLMDDIGLDVIRDIEKQYYNDSGDKRDKPPKFLDEMVVRGRIGIKSGRGFFTYPNPEYKQPGWLNIGPPWTSEKKISLYD